MRKSVLIKEKALKDKQNELEEKKQQLESFNFNYREIMDFIRDQKKKDDSIIQKAEEFQREVGRPDEEFKELMRSIKDGKQLDQKPAL
mmetsp:Transcript_1209/g.2208  ORF Transcript_1209/g.2208 Transcript_1209/m.2208 type:complete len:88 (+) Transcript_1209:65-328(+)